MLALFSRKIRDLNPLEEGLLCVSLPMNLLGPIRSRRGRYVIKQADIR